MTTARITTLVTCITLYALVQGWAAEPWPAEAWTLARTLTHLDPDFRKNISGACYNPESETFWVCRNGGPSAFWALKKDKSGDWVIAESGGRKAKYDVGKGDLEGICQADFRKDLVYVIVEGKDRIRAYDTSMGGTAKLRSEWDISAYLPTKGGEGPEGITFVPDEWLGRGRFADSGGDPYASRGGMGGLMFVAHQNGGRVYVFDLSAVSNDVYFVGSYKTAREESSGLEFDRSTGFLYIWHNTGANYLEVAALSSKEDGDGRRLSTVMEFTGPKGGNLEGIAISPLGAKRGLCLVVDDDNQDGAALMLFTKFAPGAVPSRK